MDNNAKLDKWNAVKKSIDTQKIIKKSSKQKDILGKHRAKYRQ